MKSSLTILPKLILRLKIELVFTILFTCILIFYCSNPYVLNPTEFILYTKYFIPVGVLVWMFVSFQMYNLMVESIPIKWLKINHIVQKPINIVINQFGIIAVAFLILQIVTAGVIASISVIIFTSGFDLFKLIFSLYIVYFTTPYILAWFIGLCSSIIYKYHSLIKSILFLCIIALWLIAIFFIEYGYAHFSIFIENSFIDPLHTFSSSSNIYLTNTSIGTQTRGYASRQINWWPDSSVAATSWINPGTSQRVYFSQTNGYKYYAQIVGQTIASRGSVTITIY